MIEQNIQAHKRYKILLIGDKGTDLYTYGNVERISPEAPIPVFNPVKQVEKVYQYLLLTLVLFFPAFLYLLYF